MTESEIRNLLKLNNVEIDPSDNRSVIKIAEDLGYITLVKVGHEPTGVFEVSDIPIERCYGRVLIPAAYGVDVFEATLASELEV